MPGSSKGRLLAGVAALLSVSLTNSGCQMGLPAGPTGSPATDKYAIRTNVDHPPHRLIPLGQSQAAGRSAEQASAQVAGTPIASSEMLAARPSIPGSEGPGERTIIASSWQPVQHLSPEAGNGPNLPGDGSGQPAAPPHPLAAHGIIDLPRPGTPTRGPGQVTPVRNARGELMLPEPGGASDKNDKNATLPEPRRVPTPQPTQPTMPPISALMPAPGVHHPGPAGPPPVPREFDKQALPPYVVEPPDVLLIQASEAVTLKTQPVQGQHLVRPDGTIGLGIYGSIPVAGKNLDQIADLIATVLHDKANQKMSVEKIKAELQVDVVLYASKFYYVITDGGGWGEQVYPIPATGNETVLDAIAKINGLPPVATKKAIWVARASLDPCHPKILPVDWRGITQCGSAVTNYQIFPGDRIFVQSDPWVRTDSYIAKRLSPVLRLFGATLLGASTVNTIKLGSSLGGSGTGTGVGGISGTSGVVR
jgi:polysaccharide export outer membrane protein